MESQKRPSSKKSILPITILSVKSDLEQTIVTNVGEILVLSNATKANKLTNKDVTTTVGKSNYKISFQKGIPVKISCTAHF